MSRISLETQYDNKDVIQQIYMLKDSSDNYDADIEHAVRTADEAYQLASGLDGRITAVENAQTQADKDIDKLNTKVGGEVLATLTFSTDPNGTVNLTAGKKVGNVVSNNFNVSKVQSGLIKQGGTPGAFYIELGLSDGKTIRTNDFVMTGLAEDSYITGLTIVAGTDPNSFMAKVELNDGTSFNSNQFTYSVPTKTSELVNDSGYVTTDGAVFTGAVEVPDVQPSQMNSQKVLPAKQINQWITATDDAIADVQTALDGKQPVGEYATLAQLGETNSTLADVQITANAADGKADANSLAIAEKQDKLTAGDNITIVNNVISSSFDKVDAYTKAETNGLLAGKVSKTGERDMSGDYIIKDNIRTTESKLTYSGFSVHHKIDTSLGDFQNTEGHAYIGIGRTVGFPEIGLSQDEIYNLPRYEFTCLPSELYSRSVKKGESGVDEFKISVEGGTILPLKVDQGDIDGIVGCVYTSNGGHKLARLSKAEGKSKLDVPDVITRWADATTANVPNADMVSSALNGKQAKGDYALKSEIPSVAGLATETYVDNKVTSVYKVMGSCTTAELAGKAKNKGDVWNLTDAGSYGPIGTNVVYNGTAWDALGGTYDLDKYALKSEVPSIAGLATESSVTALADRVTALENTPNAKGVDF